MGNRCINRYGFRACLHQSKMTQKELAKTLGVKYSIVNRMARGGWEPPEDLFQRTLTALGETDPARITEDWPLAEAAAEPGIHHASRQGDLIIQAVYDRSPGNVHHWRRVIEILASMERHELRDEGKDNPGDRAV